MNIIDCTPPADFPTLCLMMSETGFYVRIAEGENVRTVSIPGEATLPGAVQAADRLGYRCERYCDTRGGLAGYPSKIPNAVRRG